MENEDDISFHSEEQEGSSEDDSSVDSEENFRATWQGIWENDANTTTLAECGDSPYIQNITDEGWEELGRDISNNTHLTNINLLRGALNDHNTPLFFRGLTRSSSITQLSLYTDFSVSGICSMVPFLQNANNLTHLTIASKQMQSDGFHALFQALRDSPIKKLFCVDCDIESIEIDSEHIPRKLTELRLCNNRINADGCRELTKLLQGGDSTLTELSLDGNEIDDEGVDILVDALRTNTTLEALNLRRNKKISKQGQIMLLKLVNDISSIKAALQSNHSLWYLPVYYSSDGYDNYLTDKCDNIQMHTDQALGENQDAAEEGNSEAAGRMKIIDSQLRSGNRAELAKLQGVSQSLYSEIGPLYLPEVLALVDLYHGSRELYVALRSSIAGVISIVNRKECLLQQRSYHRAKIDAIIDAEIAVIEDGEGLVEMRKKEGI